MTRETVLESALHLFGHRGFDGTTLDAIAKRAGVTSATLYHHFGSKEAIYHEAYDHVMTRIVDGLASAVDDESDLRHNLAALIEASIVMATETPVLSRFAAALPFERLRHPDLFGGAPAVHTFVADMVRRGVASGAVDSAVDPERVALTVGVVLAGLTTVAAAAPEVYRSVAEDVIQLVVHGEMPTTRPQPKIARTRRRV